jgi:hypothetical protein
MVSLSDPISLHRRLHLHRGQRVLLTDDVLHLLRHHFHFDVYLDNRFTLSTQIVGIRMITSKINNWHLPLLTLSSPSAPYPSIRSLSTTKSLQTAFVTSEQMTSRLEIISRQHSIKFPSYHSKRTSKDWNRSSMTSFLVQVE